jgi:UDP-glucuronate 4-epimerase
MAAERVLVTGASGCLGAWVVRNLIREHVPTAALSLSGNLHRLKLTMSADELAEVDIFTGDVADFGFLSQVLRKFQATRVIHLAALQLPFCQADPARGALTNVLGTVNVFEAAKRAGLRRVVYASTTAVYGPEEEYDPGPLQHNAPLRPRSHYGVYKQANEAGARVYWLEEGISSLGLRPYVVYGPGRDQGLTSTPTKAMLAAAAKRPYHITFGGRFCFQYADDVAKTFIAAARSSFVGAEVFNIGGDSVGVTEIIRAIEQAEPAVKGQLTHADSPLPFPGVVDNSRLREVLGALPQRPLSQGVAETIGIFRHALVEGIIAIDPD